MKTSQLACTPGCVQGLKRYASEALFPQDDSLDTARSLKHFRSDSFDVEEDDLLLPLTTSSPSADFSTWGLIPQVGEGCVGIMGAYCLHHADALILLPSAALLPTDAEV